jgi:hypothetical protein
MQAKTAIVAEVERLRWRILHAARDASVVALNLICR